MTKENKNIIILGDNLDCKEFLNEINKCPGISILAVISTSKDAPAIVLARELKINTSNDFLNILQENTIDFICDFTNNPKIKEAIIHSKNPDSEILGINGAKVFLSAYKKQLASSEDDYPLSYKDIFDLSPIAIVVIDINGIVLNLNGKICDWLQYKAKDAIGKNVFMLPFLSKSSKATILENFANRLEGKEVSPYEIEIKTSKGEILNGMVSETLILDNKKNPNKMLVVISDITSILSGSKEISEAQKEIRNAEEKYRIIFENSAISITMVDAQEQIISWNKSTEKLFGMTKEDLYLKPIHSLYPKKEWEKIRSYDIRAKGLPKNLETKVIKKTGEIIDIDLSLSVLKDEEGKVSGAIGFMKDITERKKAEEEIQLTQKMRDDFLSMVSHELKTPITAIEGSIGIILDEAAGDINEEQKDFLNTAKRNLDRLDCLINDVIDYQKLQLGKIKFEMQEVDLNSLVENIQNKMSNLVKKKGLSIETSLDDSIPAVICDKGKIEKVLTILIDNANKFTKKGNITIITSKYEDVVCVAVKDTGIGIKKEDLSKLFKIFGQLTTSARRETGNTGLGLVISKSIIEKHGGKIWVESEEGKGTTVYFLLSAKK